MTIRYVQITIEPHKHPRSDLLELNIRANYNGQSYNRWEAVHEDALHNHYDIIMETMVEDLRKVLQVEWPTRRQEIPPNSITPIEKEE